MNEQDPRLASLDPLTSMSTSRNDTCNIESDQSTELQVDPNRIVVYGSNLSGATTLAAEFEEYLMARGIPNPAVERLRNVAYINQAFYGGRGSIAEEYVPTLPRGVIVFPEMRQYDPFSGNGMFMDTYREDEKGRSIFGHIKELCDRYGVPLVSIRKSSNAQELEEGLMVLLADVSQNRDD